MDMDDTQQVIHRLLLEREIEQFLCMEADLLDQRRFDDWLDLITEDCRYFMPMRRNVRFGEHDRENTSEATDISWFDEGKPTLAGRVRQINTGLHWAEEPVSRICHIVSNIQILNLRENQATVKSRFLVYRNRLQDETDLFVGKREDALRKEGGQWKIARREIILDQNVLLAKSITFFF